MHRIELPAWRMRWNIFRSIFYQKSNQGSEVWSLSNAASWTVKCLARYATVFWVLINTLAQCNCRYVTAVHMWEKLYLFICWFILVNLLKTSWHTCEGHEASFFFKLIHLLTIMISKLHERDSQQTQKNIVWSCRKQIFGEFHLFKNILHN